MGADQGGLGAGQIVLGACQILRAGQILWAGQIVLGGGDVQMGATDSIIFCSVEVVLRA